MRKESRTADDYLKFIDARFDCLAKELAIWGFDRIASKEDEDSIPDEHDAED